MHPKVSIILVNYNGKKFNKGCINSILSQIYQNFEIIFVDNASTDGSVEEVENLFKKEINNGKINIIKNNENTGFTGGNNLGYKYCNGEYICLLNNDTTVPDNWLEELVKGIENNDELGAIGSVILDKGYEESIKDYIFNKHKKGILTHVNCYDTIDMTENDIKGSKIEVKSISGCCFMFKKEVVGNYLFPDFYFAYDEDVFLSNIIILKGFKLAIAKKSFVYHYGSGSFGKKPNIKKVARGSANQVINTYLFHKTKDFFILLPIIFLFHLAMCFYDEYFFTRFIGKISALLLLFKDLIKIIKLKKYVEFIMKISYDEFYQYLSYKIIDEQIVPKEKYKKYMQYLNNFTKKYLDLFNIKYHA